ncbi:hypothetical protein FD754_021112, partial [Muntiacus muntjak]
MDNQSSNEACAAPLAPSTEGEPAEALETWWDQSKSPDLGSQSNLEQCRPWAVLPQKLWMSLEDAAFTSVHWNDEGDMVVIEADLFQMEFSKIHHSGRSVRKKRMTIYHYSKFQRDKPLLLRTAQPATGTTAIKKRKKQPALTCGLWFMDSVTRGYRSSHLPSEQGCPSGECPSSNAMSVPPVTAGRDGTWELSESSPRYPDYGSVMILYNTYDSIMRGAVSVVAPNEAPEAEEEQEESSD